MLAYPGSWTKLLQSRISRCVHSRSMRWHDILARLKNCHLSSVRELTMTITVMIEEAQAAAISQVWGAVFGENGVRRDVQAAVAKMDVVDCRMFARIEETSPAHETGAQEQTRSQW